MKLDATKSKGISIGHIPALLNAQHYQVSCVISCVPIGTYAQNRSKNLFNNIENIPVLFKYPTYFFKLFEIQSIQHSIHSMFAFISIVSSNSWCVYIVHEDFKKLCARLDYLSIYWLMEHLFCPDFRRFPSSAFKLYEWACIYNEEALLNCVLFFAYNC